MQEHLKETEATERFEKRHDRAFQNKVKAVFAYSVCLKARAQ